MAISKTSVAAEELSIMNKRIYVTFHRKRVLPTCGKLREIPTTFPQLSRNFPESHNPQFPGSRNSQPASFDSCTGVYTRYTRPKNLKKKRMLSIFERFSFLF